jgi:serine/threonine-protein kinase RsbW
VIAIADLDATSGDHVEVGTRVIKGFLTNARPPADKWLLGQWTLDSFAGLRILRVSVRQAVAEQPIPHSGLREEIARRLAIVATELAANAMAHTGPPTTVRLFRTATTHILEVADNDPWLVPRLTEQRFARAGGLGLQMARKLSLDMGWFTDAGTKYVWAQVTIGRQANG